MCKTLLFIVLFAPLSTLAQGQISSFQSEVENFSYRIDRMMSRKQVVVGSIK